MPHLQRKRPTANNGLRRFVPALQNKLRPRHMLASVALAAMASCSAFPGQNLRNNYVKMVGSQGLTAVYPPREEFQVGDVFVRSYSTTDLEDLDKRAVIWLGTLTSLQDEANLYMNSRINLENTQMQGDGTAAEAKLDQTDFLTNKVTRNNLARRTLPIVAFPVVTGAATTAGSLGGAGFLTSFGLGLGASESVSLDFTDTRVFGLPLGAASAAGKFEGEYIQSICGANLVRTGFQRLELAVARLKDVDQKHICSRGRNCDVAVITRTYLTRKLKFHYSSARIARLAAAHRRSPLSDTPTTVAVPGNVDINVTLSQGDDGKQVDALLTGISNSVANSGGQDSESTGLSFLGFQGNTLGFQRNFLKPVSIAYDSINFNLDGGKDVCGFIPPELEKKK